MFATRPRRRPGARATVGLLALLAIAVPGALALRDAGPDPAEGLGAALGDARIGAVSPEPVARTAGPGSDPEPAPDPAVPRLARAGGLVVHVPAEAPVVVGYHEASTAAALELTPIGRAIENHNTTRITPPPADPRGTDYLIMSSRGRANAATSAIDIVLPEGEPVLAPVTGTVTDVRAYYLYGSHRDHRLELRPDDAPGLRVVLVHLEEPTVAAGDRVEAGTTVISGGARRFSFSSQIDRETEPDRFGHVHLEVKAADAARPGDEAAEAAAPAGG